MRAATNTIAMGLLAIALAMATAKAQVVAVEGDWQGTWRCDPADGSAASTAPAIATISAGRIKLSRASGASDEVLNGTVAANGGVVLSGRGSGPDGQPMMFTFAGILSGRSLTASGNATPVGGGSKQTCALALTPLDVPAGPTVLRGSGAPAPTPTPVPDPEPPAVPQTDVVYSGPYWHDNDVDWRHWRLLRWRQWRMARDRRHHQPTCPPGYALVAGRCRVEAIGPTTPPGPVRQPGPTTGSTQSTPTPIGRPSGMRPTPTPMLPEPRPPGQAPQPTPEAVPPRGWR
jgi:hypothetical protein